jgi:hypothetical protein
MRAGVKHTLLAATALASWLGILVQLAVSARLAESRGLGALHGILQALAYFTVLTNLLVAIGTSVCLARPSSPSRRRNAWLAALAVYIFVVGLIYTLLLRQLWQPTGAQRLADVLLHDVVPLLYVVWWLTGAPRGGLHFMQPFFWLSWPLSYFALSVLAGEVTGRYLYPFADVATLGWSTVLLNAGMLLVLFLVLGMLAVLYDRWTIRRRVRSRDP